MQVTGAGSGMTLNRMLAPWSDTNTWNSLLNGASPDNTEAASGCEKTHSRWRTCLRVVAYRVEPRTTPPSRTGFASAPRRCSATGGAAGREVSAAP